MSVLVSNGDGTFQAELEYGSDAAIAIAAADFDGDGDLAGLAGEDFSHTSVRNIYVRTAQPATMTRSFQPPLSLVPAGL